MELEEQSLISRRQKRSTAGNRMELALAELALEESNQELEDDTDFVNDKEEEDVFESDFASTDEETAAQDDANAGEKEIHEEERRERRAARARAEKATAVAHARQRITFNPETVSSISKPRTQKSKRRVSLGMAVNAETGEVIHDTTGDVGPSAVMGTKRQSQRRHTILNTTATASRMKDAEEKKAALPKKPKVVRRIPTQDELIAQALDTEEGNILEHRNYLLLEEEKRARARVVRQSISGPVLRWVSRREHVKVPHLPTPPEPAQRSITSHYSFVYASGGAPLGTTQPGVNSGTTGTEPTSAPGPPFISYIPPALQNAPSASERSPSDQSVPLAVPPAVSSPSAAETSTSPLAMLALQSSAQSTPSLAQSSALPEPPPPPPVEEHTVEVCRNYVIHELGQTQTVKKPVWKDTMYAMFGDHVPWEELRVYTSKHRPLSRPIRTCPITGLPAPYLDPRTNVPFASVTAFQTLSKILSHQYVWSNSLGCYVSRAETALPEDSAQDGRPSKRSRVGTEDV